VILTKLEWRMREGWGGASIGKVTGAPVKFVGLGEKYTLWRVLFILSALCRAFWHGDLNVAHAETSGADR